MALGLEGVLSQIDPNVIYVVVGILFISIVLALIKKAIKIALVVVVISVLLGGLAPMAKDFQANHKISVENGVVKIFVKGNTLELNKDLIKKIELVNKGVSGYKLKVTYEDGLSTIDIPDYMVNTVKMFVKENDVPIEMRD